MGTETDTERTLLAGRGKTDTFTLRDYYGGKIKKHTLQNGARKRWSRLWREKYKMPDRAKRPSRRHTFFAKRSRAKSGKPFARYVRLAYSPTAETAALYDSTEAGQWRMKKTSSFIKSPGEVAELPPTPFERASARRISESICITFTPL